MNRTGAAFRHHYHHHHHHYHHCIDIEDIVSLIVSRYLELKLPIKNSAIYDFHRHEMYSHNQYWNDFKLKICQY